jgi:hypothetical protein
MAPLTLQQVAQQQAIAEGYSAGPTPQVNPANAATQASLGNPLSPIAEPTPYFPGTIITPNLGLSLEGMDDVLAQNMVILDAAIGTGGGGSSTAIKTVTSAYPVVQADGTILANGTFTVTLATTYTKGTTFRIKNIGTGTVTVSSAVNIDGATTYVLNPYQYMSIDVQWDGTQFWVL